MIRKAEVVLACGGVAAKRRDVGPLRQSPISIFLLFGHNRELSIAACDGFDASASVRPKYFVRL